MYIKTGVKMKNNRKKQQSNKFKNISEDRIIELRSLAEKDLNSEFIKAKKNEKAAKKMKKEDEDIKSLADKIKLHRAENTPKKVKELQEEIKELKKQVDEEIEDEINDKKALMKGHSNLIKGFLEEQELILEILRGREL
jgi:hypothetical protein